MPPQIPVDGGRSVEDGTAERRDADSLRLSDHTSSDGEIGNPVPEDQQRPIRVAQDQIRLDAARKRGGVDDHIGISFAKDFHR